MGLSFDSFSVHDRYDIFDEFAEAANDEIHTEDERDDIERSIEDDSRKPERSGGRGTQSPNERERQNTECYVYRHFPQKFIGYHRKRTRFGEITLFEPRMNLASSA